MAWHNKKASHHFIGSFTKKIYINGVFGYRLFR